MKTRKPKEKHCVLWCTHISDYIHDPIPLDNLKNHTALLYITLVTYLPSKFIIKIRTVAPYNLQSLQAEHGIKSLSNILTKHLTHLGQMWPKYLSLTIYEYNIFNTPNLDNYSPYELTFGRKPRPLINLDSNPDIKVSGTFREYYELLNKSIKYLQNIPFNFKSKRLAYDY